MTEEKSGAERRKFVRINSNIPIKITIPNVDGEGMDAQLASVTRNISLGGVLIEFAAIREEMWNKLKEPDVELTMEMFFPEYNERFHVQAQVQWIKDANKFLAQYASIGLHIIEDTEVNPQFPDLLQKLRQLIPAE